MSNINDDILRKQYNGTLEDKIDNQKDLLFKANEKILELNKQYNILWHYAYVLVKEVESYRKAEKFESINKYRELNIELIHATSKNKMYHRECRKLNKKILKLKKELKKYES